MKNKGLIITLIVILSMFACALTGGLVFALLHMNSFHFNFNFNESNSVLVDSYDIDYREVNKIYFNLHSTDVQIKKSDTDKIVVEYYSNQEKNPKIEYFDGTVKVDENDYNLNCIGFCNSNRKIVVFVPSDYSKDFNIITKSGDIKSETNLYNVSFSTMSGDVFLLDGANFNISTISGDVMLGDVVSLDVITTSGDIKVSGVSDFIKAKSTSGDVSIDMFKIKINSSISTVSGDVSINNNKSNCYIDVSTVSGDKYINNSDRKSDVILNIKTTSGDISVY